MPTESPKGEPAEKRAKIMVVDDDPDLRHALSIRLRANQFDILKVCDGYSAIALAQKERPDLIILDLGLPAGDGFVVLKSLRQFPALANIPIIVLTARDPQAFKKKTLDSGAVAFFQKPVENKVLLAAIRFILKTGQDGEACSPVAAISQSAGR
jgi:DNA-binding response OmpR family regulator